MDENEQRLMDIIATQVRMGEAFRENRVGTTYVISRTDEIEHRIDQLEKRFDDFNALLYGFLSAGDINTTQTSEADFKQGLHDLMFGPPQEVQV